MCCIRQIIHKLLASICHMGIFLLFLGLLLERALSHTSICTNTCTLLLFPFLTSTHTDTVTAINHLHMFIHLIALHVDGPKTSRDSAEGEQCRQCEWAAFIIGEVEKALQCGCLLPSHMNVGWLGWRQTLQSEHGNAWWRKQGDGWDSHVSILFTGVV